MLRRAVTAVDVRDVFVGVGLAALGIGTALKYDLASSLIVIGAVLVGLVAITVWRSA